MPRADGVTARPSHLTRTRLCGRRRSALLGSVRPGSAPLGLSEPLRAPRPLSPPRGPNAALCVLPAGHLGALPALRRSGSQESSCPQSRNSGRSPSPLVLRDEKVLPHHPSPHGLVPVPTLDSEPFLLLHSCIATVLKSRHLPHGCEYFAGCIVRRQAQKGEGIAPMHVSMAKPEFESRCLTPKLMSLPIRKPKASWV